MVPKDPTTGYDKEEEYFYKLNKELIERKRRELDQQHAAQSATESKGPHWMKCPKCGADLAERDLLGIRIDECAACHGIYLDRGELETLLESSEPKGFLSFLKKKIG